jgi:hypothetical protein
MTNGLSTSAWRPASSTLRVWAWCSVCGVLTITASHAPGASNASTSETSAAPVCAAIACSAGTGCGSQMTAMRASTASIRAGT